MNAAHALHHLLATRAADWPPLDRELVEEVAIALLQRLLDQLRGCDIDQEIRDVRAAAWSLGVGASMSGTELEAEWLREVLAERPAFWPACWSERGGGFDR